MPAALIIVIGAAIMLCMCTVYMKSRKSKK